MQRPAPFDIRAILRPAKVLLIVPPFGSIERPSLGLHLLQGLARRIGVEIQVLYANMLFAAYVDHGTYTTLAKQSNALSIGERMFARAAYGVPPLGYDHGQAIDDKFARFQRELGSRFGITVKNLMNVEAMIDGYLESFVPAVAAGGFDVVGCTSSFEQNASSIAILRSLKRRRPETITVMGGANCEGDMAEGLAALTRDVDYIFDGESEESFVAFLEQLQRGERPTGRTIHGKPCQDLDALPTPDYADYYAQLRTFVPSSRWTDETAVNYETSRGCWWGAKSHCTFCGLNGNGMASREKSADRVIAELKELLARHPNKRVMTCDNIMPHTYWKTLLPRLPEELPGISLFYEHKANISLKQCRLLADAGVLEIQPGIEALSTGLLKLMGKGTTCAQNLALLRYARVNNIHPFWNLLTHFPHDRLEFYEETLELVPLLVHLVPPGNRDAIIIDRFSPYFDHPERYDVRDIVPKSDYLQMLPRGAPISRIAYHFAATYPSEAHDHPELFEKMDTELDLWRHRWRKRAEPPVLMVERKGDRYELSDTRGLPGLPEHQHIDEAQAIAALVARPLPAPERPGDAWARAQRVVVERDRKLVPLALAHRDLLAELEDRFLNKSQLVVTARDEPAAL